MAETFLGGGLASNPGWNLAPNQHVEMEPAMSPAAFAVSTEPTDVETAALTAIAAEAAAEAAASATADQESMDYVEVLLELPQSPPVLACTQADPDVKPHASHLRMALENYGRQQQWDNYNYPTAMQVGKSVAGLNPLFNPSASGHHPRAEAVVVGSGASTSYAPQHDSTPASTGESCGDMGSTDFADVEQIDESLFCRNTHYTNGNSPEVKKERDDKAHLSEEIPESSSLDSPVVASPVNNPGGYESLEMLPPGSIRVRREIPENQAKTFICGADGCTFRASRLSNLKGHVNAIHLKIQFYHCPFCLTHKSRTNYFTKHLKEKHGDKLDRLDVSAEMVRYAVGHAYRRNNQLATAKKPKNFDDREMATIMAFLRNQSPPNSPLLVPSP